MKHLNNPIYTSIYAFVCILIGLQNLGSSLLSLLDPSISRMSLIAKDVVLMMVLALHAVYILRRGKIGRFELLLFGWTFWVVLNALMVSFDLILSARQMLIIPLLLMFGYHFANRVSFDKMFGIAMFLLAIIAGSAYVDYLLHNRDEWLLVALGVPEFSIAKGTEIWAFGPHGLPGNYYSYDLLKWYPEPIRRAVSIVLEPTLLGQLMAFPALYYLISKKYAYFLYFFLVMIMALSKGGLLALAVGWLFYVYAYKLRKHGKRLLLLMSPILLALIIALLNVLEFGSMPLHIAGLVDNVANLRHHILGAGIGNAGNFAVLAQISEGGESDILSGESYFGAAVGQLGIVALVAYAALLVATFRLEVMINEEMSVKYAGIGVLICGFLSESAISFIGSFYVFSALGALFYLSRLRNRRHISNTNMSSHNAAHMQVQ
jgi:hypothetical protein